MSCLQEPLCHIWLYFALHFLISIQLPQLESELSSDSNIRRQGSYCGTFQSCVYTRAARVRQASTSCTEFMATQLYLRRRMSVTQVPPDALTSVHVTCNDKTKQTAVSVPQKFSNTSKGANVSPRNYSHERPLLDPPWYATKNRPNRATNPIDK